MSRSYHQRHPTRRRYKCPRTILDIVVKDGKSRFIFRKRKMKPYGRKDLIGYGEEIYDKKYGEYFATQVDKKAYRMKVKIEIKNIFG